MNKTVVITDERAGLLLSERFTSSVVQAPEAEGFVIRPEEQAVVVQIDKDSDVVVQRDVESVVITTQGGQGPPGPSGAPGPAGGQVFQRMAGMDTSALLVVYEDMFSSVWPADHDVERDVLALLGVTVNAAARGQPIHVQRIGYIDDAAWQLEPGKRVFLGRQGRLTQEPPQAGYDVLIGTSITATRLLLNIQDPIELE